MVSLQSSSVLLPEAKRPPPRLSLADGATATSKKRKRDGGADGEEVDGIELNFDAAPLPLEWQRCLDIKSGQIHYYNTRTHKRTSKDPRAEAPELHCAAAAAAPPPPEEASNNCSPPGLLDLDLELNLNFEPRRAVVHEKKKKASASSPPPAAEAKPEEMVAAVCMRCHMLVMMCRACPACPNCKFLHPSSGRGSAAAPPPEREPAPLRLGLGLGLQLLCCKD